MKEDKSILASVENLFQSQSNFKKYILFTFILGIILCFMILIAGVIASWVKIPKAKVENQSLDKDVYQEGSIKYQSAQNVVLLNDSFFEGQIVNLLKSQGSNDQLLKSLADHLNTWLQSKIIVFTSNPSTLSKPNIEQAFSYIHQQNQRIVDSLNNVVNRKKFLDNVGTSLLERISLSEDNIVSLKNEINNLQYVFIGDFPMQGYEFKYQIGKVNSVKLENTNKLVIRCINSAPLISAAFLAKVGVSSTNIDESELQRQSITLQQTIHGAELKDKEQKKIQQDKINEEVSLQRKNYRSEFYNRWYSTLLLLINSMIFILLLMRYWIIISQKKLPRKSTDIIYYATNRTSRLFRIIALVIIAFAILQLIMGFILNLINKPEIFSSFVFVHIEGKFIHSLIDPPLTFIVTILTTWFFILMSEWIDFISNCYEVIFHKAYEEKIKKTVTKSDKEATDI